MEPIVSFVALAAVVLLWRQLPAGAKPKTALSLVRLRWGDALPLGVTIACAVGLYGPFLARIPHERRLLQTFSPDYSTQVALVKEMVDRGSFDLNIERDSTPRSDNRWRFSYGALHINLSILLGRLAAIVHEPGFGGLARLHSALQFLGLLGSLALLYLWASAVGGRLVGLFAGLVYLLPYKTMFLVAHPCSPDHIQQALLFGSLTACCMVAMNSSMRGVLVAALLAGLAFGTKYAGGFLLPLVVGAFFVGSGLPARHLLLRCARTVLGVAALGFALGFVASNPQAVLNPLYFVESFQANLESVTYEYAFAESVAAGYWNLFWRGFLRSDQLLLVLVGLGTCLLVLGRWRRPREAGDFVSSTAVAWMGCYLSILALVVRYAEPGVFYPVWPVLALSAALAVRGVGRMLGWFFYTETGALGTLVSTLMLVAVVGYECTSKSAVFYPVRVDRRILFNPEEPFYDGIWELSAFVSDRYPVGTRVLVDHPQIYVPARFQDVEHRYLPTMGELKAGELQRTDVIILSRTDAEVEHAISQGYYAIDSLTASRRIYSEIRTGGLFRRAAAFDYPPGWFVPPVEVWERRVGAGTGP